MQQESYFDGTLSQLIWMSFSTFFIVVFTLLIGTPWAVCRLLNWETSHTVIEGRRLQFVGKPMDLFKHWIKWLLLTITTLRIYGFWVNIKMKQWTAKKHIVRELKSRV